MTGRGAGLGAARVERLAEVAPMVRRICVARLGPVDGQDAAQEVLESVWRAQQRPDFAEGSLFGYAAATARYRVMHGYADRDRADVPAGALADLVWADPAPGPAERVERAEAAAEANRQVGELLAQLPPRERQVMHASGLGGRPGAETAAELGMSPSGVRSAQVRAMARMRELVGAVSPNPLAARASENQRRRQAAAVRAAGRGGPVRGRGGSPLPREVRDAGRAAAARGRTTQDLAAQFGVSERTATRWRAAAAHIRIDAPTGRDGAQDPLEQARRAVAALPTPEQARAALDERERVHPSSVHASGGDLTAADTDTDTDTASASNHSGAARSGEDADAWSAA